MSAPTRRDIASVVAAMCDQSNSDGVARAVASYLIAERRSSELDAIMRLVRTIREQNGVHEVTATSAFALSTHAKREIISQSGGKNVILNEVIDPDVIGGVRVETSDTQLDLTVRNRLQHLMNAAK